MIRIEKNMKKYKKLNFFKESKKTPKTSKKLTQLQVDHELSDLFDEGVFPCSCA